MKKKYAFAAMIVLAMGLAACSLEPVGETSNPGAVTGLQTANEESAGAGTMKTEMESVKTEAETVEPGTEPVKTEDEKAEIPENPETEDGRDDADFRQSVPIVASVESYEGDIIAVNDSDTGSILYFSTKEAEVIEGDVPIAAGDIVEIIYRGAQGDREHPGTAVKIVEFSMRQCTIMVSVESYENGIIAVRDMDTNIILYFSTQEAEIIEGDTPIAAGDIVEVTYRGAEGDEAHPGIAVRVVAESMVSYFVP